MKKIIISIVVIILLGSILVASEQNTETTNSTKKDIASKVEISEISFKEEHIELDLKETKLVILNIIPTNANMEELKLNSTNLKIATFEKDIETSKENGVSIKIQPIAEGECEVYATYNDIESNKIKVKIIDSERIEREKKEAEEKARKEAEQKAKKEAEEQAKKQTQTTTTQKNNSTSPNTSSQKNTSSSNSQSNSKNTQGKSVYRTPSGKRYHFDPDCGGKNSYKTTLDSAKSSGLTPCKKCAQ